MQTTMNGRITLIPPIGRWVMTKRGTSMTNDYMTYNAYHVFISLTKTNRFC